MSTKPSLPQLTTIVLGILPTFTHAIPTIPAQIQRNSNGPARRSVSLELTRNPNYVPNGPAAYAHALKKWGADVPSELTNSLAVMKGNGEPPLSFVVM